MTQPAAYADAVYGSGDAGRGDGEMALVLRKGASWKRTITWRDGEGNPVNLEGFTATLNLRSTQADPPKQLVLTSDGDGGITLNETQGQIQVEVPQGFIDEGGWEYGRYALILSQAGGGGMVLLHGRAYRISGVMEG